MTRHWERAITPIAFAQWLLDLAATAQPKSTSYLASE